MAAKTKTGKSTFGKVCGILVDIFIVPIMIVAFICALIMSSAKANGKVPSILGNSIVTVRSGSMAPAYNIGDVLIIDQSIDKGDIKVGENIAFWGPKASGYLDENGNSIVVFHRVVRIIYVDDGDGDKIKTFVCHGDAAAELDYVLAGNGDGDYIQTENGWELDTENGTHVVKLLNDNDTTSSDSYNESELGSEPKDPLATLQYVTEEFVVGKLKSKAGPFVSGLIGFCTSSNGIILLVIIPSLLMLALVVVGIAQESKKAKKEREDQYAYAQALSGKAGAEDAELTQLEAMLDSDQTDKKKPKAKQKQDAKPQDEQPILPDEKESKTTEVVVNEIIQNQNTETAKPVVEKPEKPKAQKAPAEPKAAPAKAPAKAEATTSSPKAKPKAAPAKVEAAPKAEPKAEAKAAPAKAPTAPKAETKVPAKTPAAPKTAPAKEETKTPAAPKTTSAKEETKTPAAPKAAPAKAPTAPKAATVKEEQKAPAAPKTPAAPKAEPKVAPAKTPAAPKAAPAKAPAVPKAPPKA